VERQRRLLGPLAESVRWTNIDLTAARRGGAALAEVGLVFANEVLDCQAHHKVVAPGPGPPGAVYVVPRRVDGGPRRRSTPVRRRGLGKVRPDEPRRERAVFEEMPLPLGIGPGLEPFLRRHHAELFARNRVPSPTFACPSFERLVRNAGTLHTRGEVLWIDY